MNNYIHILKKDSRLFIIAYIFDRKGHVSISVEEMFSSASFILMKLLQK